jgi:hypothetical protein
MVTAETPDAEPNAAIAAAIPAPLMHRACVLDMLWSSKKNSDGETRDE